MPTLSVPATSAARMRVIVLLRFMGGSPVSNNSNVDAMEPGGQALRPSTKREPCDKLAGSTEDGCLLRSIGPVGSAERHRRIEPYGVDVARDDDEHDDGRQVGQGGEQLRRYRDAR